MRTDPVSGDLKPKLPSPSFSRHPLPLPPKGGSNLKKKKRKKMNLILYHIIVFLTLFLYGIYTLTLSTLSFLKRSSSSSPAPACTPRPYHPLPISPDRPHLLRHLPLYLLLLSLLLALSHLLSLPTPSSLHTSLSLLLLASLSVLPLPSDLSFLLISLSFLLLSLSPPPVAADDLRSKTHSVSCGISAASSALSFAILALPRSFPPCVALAGSVSLHGLWSLQTGLSLYVDAFIPAGCHRLLDLAEAATRCDVEESRVRAERVLDLMLGVHVAVAAAVVVGVYVAAERVVGRRGVYEAVATAEGREMEGVRIGGKGAAQA